MIRAIVESEDGIMKASDTLKNISDDGWRWVIQGQIEGKKRDYTSGLLAAERRGRAAGLEQGLEQGIKEGLEQGMHQNAVETAKKLLGDGMPPEKVANYCSIPLEEVKELQKTPQGSGQSWESGFDKGNCGVGGRHNEGKRHS